MARKINGMKEILKFLKELNRNNNREWFEAHKCDYLKIKAKVEDLAQRLINEVAKFDPEAAYLAPSDCTYRIYRDTRFSQDKTHLQESYRDFCESAIWKEGEPHGVLSAS